MVCCRNLRGGAAHGAGSAEERIQVLDVLRGFALFGILVINMWVFRQPWTTWPAGEAIREATTETGERLP